MKLPNLVRKCFSVNC